MKTVLLAFNALFPYLILLCVLGLSTVGPWPLAVLGGLWGVFLVLNSLFLRRRLRAPDPEALTLASMVIKLVQIPAFAAIFLVGVITAAFPLLPLLLILLDWFAVLLTGLVSAGNLYLLYKNGTLGRTEAEVLGVLSFLFCADVVAAIIAWQRDRRRKPSEPVRDPNTDPGKERLPCHAGAEPRS